MLSNRAYNRYVPIVTSATVNFDASVSTTGGNVKPCEAIWVGGAGIVVAVAQNGEVASFTCVAGSLLPIQAIRVNATSTATLMIALYQN